MKYLKPSLKIFLFALVVFSISSQAIPSQENQTIVSRVVNELQTKIPEWWKERDIPGAAVAIVDDKKILWHGVYGYTSRLQDKKITTETLFSIQSMSKSFTALGVLMAVQDRLLDLDAPITVYIPNFTVNSIYEDHSEKKMTLRLLLAHRAGFTHEAPVGGNYDCRPHTFNEHILSISNTWLRYPVDYRFSYSNLGIDLAGYILQEKAGKPFWDYIEEKILIPLGMTQSTLDIEEIKKRKNRAIGHISKRMKIERGIPVEIPMIPAGGVYTNILDMAKYLSFHINKGQVKGKQFLNKELIEQMHTVAFPEKNQRFGYGLCLTSSPVSRTYVLNHGGGGYGFITSMTIYPELKLGIVTLTNSEESRISSGRIQNIINRIIEEQQGETEPWPKKAVAETYVPIAPGSEKVKNLIGIYSNAEIGYKNKEFGITLGRDFYPLKMYTDNGEWVGLFGKFSELRVKNPLKNRPGTLVVLNRRSGTCQYYDFQKPDKSLDKPGPDKPEWKQYLGLYKVLVWGRRTSGNFRVSVKEGYLTLNNMRCFEHLPGLFFTSDGEALDFRGTIPTYRNAMLIKRR